MTVGAFWSSVATRHEMLLRTHGRDRFKRTVNFEYFQRAVINRRDAVLRRLPWRLLRSGRLPLGLRARMDDEGRRDPLLTQTIGPRAYAAFVGLLWQYAATRDRLGVLTLEEPAEGTPIPVRWRGRLITQDLAWAALELNWIDRRVPLRSIRSVLEIGGGYGRLAFAAVRTADVAYTILDIPPAADLARGYLDAVLGPGRVRVIGPETEPPPVDLAVSVGALDEMPRAVVERYFAVIDRTAKWCYVKAHTEAPTWCPESAGGTRTLPYPAHWRLVADVVDPVMPTYHERLYHVGA